LKHCRLTPRPVTGQRSCSVTRQSSHCGETRGFATPPRSGCAVSAELFCSAAILSPRRQSTTTGVTVTGHGGATAR
jgi:hypothetical protein